MDRRTCCKFWRSYTGNFASPSICSAKVSEHYLTSVTVTNLILNQLRESLLTVRTDADGCGLDVSPSLIRLGLSDQSF
ncbi:Hypothetical predicted protein [Xyrichtys novacula]|uniref:Uncharacterized protein n=1 Tax=Xyrichtys novacula TaxID=13765 RepID=A0AAV1H0G5_XYRNO|nr:Hypothetical predicted protein [Xyrichtys novacula]